MEQIIREKIDKAPKTPGVYIFYKKHQPLYIGKASNLRSRLQSYLRADDFKSERLRENATSLKLIPLRSEIEALLEESKLIKKLNPLYNVLWRDDKSYFYAIITKDKFPRLFVVHKSKTPHPKPYTLNPILIGPFTEGRALRLVLRMLRRSFPYCTCPKPHFRLCLNSQIGNCPGFCCRKNSRPTATETKNYLKNICLIRNFLLGKPLKSIQKNLKLEEKTALEKILAHREFLENFDQPSSPVTQKPSYLIEGYDVSHLSGKETAAGLTAWYFDGQALKPRKKFWRKFIIRTAKSADDPAAIAEALNRRLNHPEWPYPDLIIIDGGLTQFKAAQRTFLNASAKSGSASGGKSYPPALLSQDESGRGKLKAKIISFAKPGKLVYGLGKNPKKLSQAPAELQKIIPAVIFETHRFTISFHRQRRRKSFLGFV